MKERNERWQAAINELPLIAILRGLVPEQSKETGQALIDAGFQIIEVPLNSPRPIETLSILNNRLSGQAIIGAGTVLNPTQVESVAHTGSELIIAPNLDSAVAAAANQQHCIYCPGVLTPTEAFSAIDQGASGLKLFPAEMITPAIVKALRAVLPEETPLFPVGGISPDRMQDYLAAGANGFGIGSALFKPGDSASSIYTQARAFVSAYKKAQEALND
ncbi:MAG: 2-dehydro-3-deoxy-6-phosphogalactonate aldolase [Acidiferrobacterales bacterium]|nr:2-dehydro-3-deoxy-6-phosphogalactonate aldolase [Acidiferrobacterales bacterium]